MKRRSLALFGLVFALAAGDFTPAMGADGGVRKPLSIAPLSRETPVSFQDEILPFLRQNCLACHNQTRAKGDLVLESPQSIRKGGATGPGLIAGHGFESLLFRAASHQDPDLVMPPTGNKANANDLSPEALALLKLWIDQGAQGEVNTAAPIAWQGMPTNWLPAMAVALSPDGQWLACGRGNRVEILHLPSQLSVASLLDNAAEGAAHRDVVSALAFSPDGSWLASASYREVKLWKRQPPLGPAVNPAAEGEAWTAFASSSDGRWWAMGKRDGTVSLRDARRGAFGALRVGTGAVVLLSFSLDGRRVAAACKSGELMILNADPMVQMARGKLDEEPTGLAWLGNDRQLGITTSAGSALRRWGLPPSNSDELQSLPVLNGLPATPVAIMRFGTDGRGLFVACADGQARTYDYEQTSPRLSFSHDAPIDHAAISLDGAHAATAGQDGVVKLWELSPSPKIIAELKGDWRRHFEVTRAEQFAELNRQETEFYTRTLQRAEDDSKKAAEALVKTSEKFAADEKALQEKKVQLADQRKTGDAAAKEKAELEAALKAAVDTFAAAEKSMQDAKAAALEGSEKAGAAQLAFELATQSKVNLERVATGLAGTSDETNLRKARESASAATAEAAARQKQAEDARTVAAQGLEELSKSAFAAGQSKAALDRANAEVPPKQKQVDERLTAATKAIHDLEGQVSKAEISRTTSEGDLTLARKNADTGITNLAEAKAGLAAAQEAGPKFAASAELSRQQATADLGSRLDRLVFSPDGATLASSTRDGRFLTWNAISGATGEALSTPRGEHLEFAFEGNSTLRSVTSAGISKINLAPSWKLERTLGPGGPDSKLVDRVEAVAFSPDSSKLATGGGEPSRGGEIKLWSVADGSLLRDFGFVHSDSVLALAFSPHGDQLLSGGADRFARLLDVTTGTILRNFEGHTHHVMGVAWQPDGRTLATAGADGVVKLWDPKTGERLKNLDGFGKEVVAVQSIGVSDQFVAVSGAGQARVFKRGGDTVRNLETQGAFLEALATSSDGRFAAAGDSEGVVRVWTLEDGKLLNKFQPRAQIGAK